MRKGQNRQFNKSNKDNENLIIEMASKLDEAAQSANKRIAEMASKIDSIKAELERSRFEQDIYKIKFDVKELTKDCLETIDILKSFATEYNVAENICYKINNLRVDIDNKCKYLLLACNYPGPHAMGRGEP